METNVTIKGKHLFFNGKMIREFPYAIEKYTSWKDKVLVMLNIPEGEIYNENIFCFTANGKFIWQIEKKEEFDKDCPFTGMSFNGEQFTPYKQCGVLTTVDMETGAIMSSKLIK